MFRYARLSLLMHAKLFECLVGSKGYYTFLPLFSVTLFSLLGVFNPTL